MKHETLKQAFLQGGATQAAEIFNELLRTAVREGLYSAMEEEVNSLCGPKHYPNPDADYQRAGSERGVAYINGTKEELTRPRVRHKEEGEKLLEVYKAASRQRNLFEEVVAAVTEGVSMRGADRLTKGGVSKSTASRMWVEKSKEQLETLRTRPLDQLDLLAIMIDGVRLSEEVWVIIAVGITVEGTKHALDFEQGSSENATAVGDLLERLRSRGVDQPKDRKLLVLRDGSKPIRNAVNKYWSKAVQQECVVHLHRRLRDKLRKRDRADLDRMFKVFREAEGKKAGEEAFDELFEFVSERNAAAGIELGKRKDYFLAFHRLDLPSTLNTSFLSTNIIENSIKNWREATSNVKQWKEKSDMVSRWAASGLLWAEASFRKIDHYSDLPLLAAALSSSATASSLRSSASAPDDNAELSQD